MSVKIAGSHDETVIRITDSGRGFDVNNVLNTPPSDGRYMGLRGMKERIKYLNAVTDIDSRIGKGTKIKITVTKKGDSRLKQGSP